MLKSPALEVGGKKRGGVGREGVVVGVLIKLCSNKETFCGSALIFIFF